MVVRRRDQIIALLRGDIPVRNIPVKDGEPSLATAFWWNHAYGGFDYWVKVYRRNYLTDEDKVRLLMMLGE